MKALQPAVAYVLSPPTILLAGLLCVSSPLSTALPRLPSRCGFYGFFVPTCMLSLDDVATSYTSARITASATVMSFTKQAWPFICSPNQAYKSLVRILQGWIFPRAVKPSFRGVSPTVLAGTSSRLPLDSAAGLANTGEATCRRLATRRCTTFAQGWPSRARCDSRLLRQHNVSQNACRTGEEVVHLFLRLMLVRLSGTDLRLQTCIPCC